MTTPAKKPFDAEMHTPWKYCPECGSKNKHLDTHFENKTNHYICKDCGQEWFDDIDYTDTVRENLKKDQPKRYIQTFPRKDVDALIEALEWIEESFHASTPVISVARKALSELQSKHGEVNITKNHTSLP